MGLQPSRILPGLYLGGSKVLEEDQWWTEEGITHCVSICHECPSDHLIPPEKKIWINVPDVESTNLAMYFDRIVDFVHAARVAGGTVYIHCAAGISRSTTMTCAYLMTALELDFETALAFVITKRECVYPNEGFRRQLKQFQNGSLKALSKKLHEEYPEGSKLIQSDLEEVSKSRQQAEATQPVGEDTVLPAPAKGASPAHVLASAGQLGGPSSQTTNEEKAKNAQSSVIEGQEEKVRNMLQPLKNAGYKAGGDIGLEWLDKKETSEKSKQSKGEPGVGAEETIKEGEAQC
mmetsp:Transcript_5260/g.7270  ORF Transcript_5260/g.7270 Transcript_5260/m.7270 type:complete len:291 (+) Transcript_5260:84-956(+)